MTKIRRLIWKLKTWPATMTISWSRRMMSWRLKVHEYSPKLKRSTAHKKLQIRLMKKIKMRKIRVLKLLAFENSDTTLMTTRSRVSHMMIACTRQFIREVMTAKHTLCAPKSKQRSIHSRWTSFRTVPSIASKKTSLCLLQLIHQLVRQQSPSTPSRSRSKDNSA